MCIRDSLYPAFTQHEIELLDDARRAVLISMSFQMGGGVRKFRNFTKAVKEQNWGEAAAEMLYRSADSRSPSLWHGQTPERCERHAYAMQWGYFKEYGDHREEVPAASVESGNVETIRALLTQIEAHLDQIEAKHLEEK